MCRTPSSPPSARPCTYGRPMTTASAPRASARKASVPVRTLFVLYLLVTLVGLTYFITTGLLHR